MRWTAPSCAASDGSQVSLREITTAKQTTLEPSIYQKNMKRVVYVTGDVAGRVESPVYAIFKMNQTLDQMKVPAGYARSATTSCRPNRPTVTP